MAIIEKYANFNLATGANDGTSEADAWQTPADIIEAAGERVNVKDGARYDIATSWASTADGSATQPIMIRGYTSTIGDLGRTKLSSSIASGINLTGKYVYFEDFDIEMSQTNFVTGCVINSQQGRIKNLKFVHLTTGARNRDSLLSGTSALINAYIEGRADNTASSPVLTVSSGSVTNTIVKSTNGQIGIDANCGFNGVSMSHVLVYSTASPTLAGIMLDDLHNTVGCDIDQFTIDGFDEGLLFVELPTARVFGVSVANGIISGAVDAITTDEATTRTGVSMANIAFYDNINNFSAMGDNEVVNPILCTVDPYEDSANADFTPNDAANGGALLRGASVIGII